MPSDTKVNPYYVIKDKTLIAISAALIILNIFDGGLTLVGLNLKIVNEVNPLMRWLISVSPQGFMAVKFLIPVILSLILWKKRHELKKVYVYALWFVLVLYIVAMLLHAYWIAYLLTFMNLI